MRKVTCEQLVSVAQILEANCFYYEILCEEEKLLACWENAKEEQLADDAIMKMFPPPKDVPCTDAAEKAFFIESVRFAIQLAHLFYVVDHSKLISGRTAQAIADFIKDAESAITESYTETKIYFVNRLTSLLKHVKLKPFSSELVESQTILNSLFDDAFNSLTYKRYDESVINTLKNWVALINRCELDENGKSKLAKRVVELCRGDFERSPSIYMARLHLLKAIDAAWEPISNHLTRNDLQWLQEKHSDLLNTYRDLPRRYQNIPVVREVVWHAQMLVNGAYGSLAGVLAVISVPSVLLAFQYWIYNAIIPAQQENVASFIRLQNRLQDESEQLDPADIAYIKGAIAFALRTYHANSLEELADRMNASSNWLNWVTPLATVLGGAGIAASLWLSGPPEPKVSPLPPWAREMLERKSAPQLR